MLLKWKNVLKIAKWQKFNFFNCLMDKSNFVIEMHCSRSPKNKVNKYILHINPHLSYDLSYLSKHLYLTTLSTYLSKYNM